jgi:hypothetical protein
MALPVPRPFVRRVTALLAEEKGLISLEEREGVARDLSGVLAHLRASVELHRRDGNRAAVTDRVAATLAHFGKIGTELEGRGLHQTGRCVREGGRATVVFAEVTMRGGWMPATSNGVERIMGMIADRCKKKWAHLCSLRSGRATAPRARATVAVLHPGSGAGGVHAAFTYRRLSRTWTSAAVDSSVASRKHWMAAA